MAAKPKVSKASKAVKMAPLRDPRPPKPTVPTYSIMEKGIETALAQGKRFTPNNFKNNINSTGMSPRELEYQLAGTKEQLEIWKETYGENGVIPPEEVRRFGKENNATQTIQHRRQRMHPNALAKDMQKEQLFYDNQQAEDRYADQYPDEQYDNDPVDANARGENELEPEEASMSDMERDDIAIDNFAAGEDGPDPRQDEFDAQGNPIQSEPLTEVEALRAQMEKDGRTDLYSERQVNPRRILQATTRNNPAVSLGENPRSVKTARFGEYTYPQQELYYRDNEAFRDLRELQEKARFLGGDTEDMRKKLDEITKSLIPKPYSVDKATSAEIYRKTGVPLRLSLDDPMRTYQEDLFIPNPASPQADVPFSELAASGSFGKSIQEDPAKFLHNNIVFAHGIGTMPDPALNPPLGNYGVPTKLGMTLNQAEPIDPTDAHNNPHYRSHLTPDESARVLVNIQNPAAQALRKTQFANDKTRDLHPLLAYQLDPKAGTYVAQGQLLRQMAEENLPLYLPTGDTVHRSDMMPHKASIPMYGKAGGIHGTSTRSLLDRLLAEGVPESEVSFGPAPGDYAETHNQLQISDAARQYLFKHGIRALTVGGLTGAGAAAMDQIPEQQVGY